MKDNSSNTQFSGMGFIGTDYFTIQSALAR